MKLIGVLVNAALVTARLILLGPVLLTYTAEVLLSKERLDGNCVLFEVHTREPPVNPLHVMTVATRLVMTVGLGRGL